VTTSLRSAGRYPRAHYDVKQWVNYFIHSGHLHIDGLKMSKSLKNFITIRAALTMYSARQIRFLFLLHQWSDPMAGRGVARRTWGSSQRQCVCVTALRVELRRLTTSKVPGDALQCSNPKFGRRYPCCGVGCKLYRYAFSRAHGGATPRTSLPCRRARL